MFIVLLSYFFHPPRQCGTCTLRRRSCERSSTSSSTSAGFVFLRAGSACRGPSEGRKMAPLAMLEVGDRVESRAHSFGSREPQGGRNLVGGA